MSINKLCKSLEKCKDKFVFLEIIGAISIPYSIEKFEFVESEEFIAFGEKSCENFPFIIYKESICDIVFLNNDLEEVDEVHLEFGIVNDEFLANTTLRIVCEMGGHENE